MDDNIYKFFFITKDTIDTATTYTLTKENLFEWFNRREDVSALYKLELIDYLRGNEHNKNMKVIKIFKEAIDNDEIKLDYKKEQPIGFDMSDNTLLYPINYISIVIY